MKIKLPLLFIAFIFLIVKVWAQQVPSRMLFADMDLRLTSGAIKDIQADVDALTRSEKYFQKKLERVDMYMPIIERIFKEEGLPEDFKYLVIQESALISDAVSSSNAVGFWQFKEISGLENDLQIDRHIDERMNIVSSSRAAAAYLKSHNEYFNNWAYALIAYQRGRGGAADVIDEANFGESRLKINSDTYWYLKKFLAHKVAFENALGTSNPPYYLKEIDNVQGTTLKAISKEENVSIELLEEYNKWIKRGKIPEDKNYTVVVPLSNLEKIEKLQNQKKTDLENLPGDIDDSLQQNFPLVENYPSKSDRSIPHQVEINGLDGIYAPKGYTVKKLAETAGVDEYKFRKWNDLTIRAQLKTGKIYYLRRKRNRAKFYYHTVSQNETMWEISQKYGLKLKKLYRKNRMEPPQQPTEGRVLWLRHNRPANVDIEYRKAPETQIKEENTNAEQAVEHLEKALIPEKESELSDEGHQPLEIDSSSLSSDSVDKYSGQTKTTEMKQDSLIVAEQIAPIGLDSSNSVAETKNPKIEENQQVEPEITVEDEKDDEPSFDENHFTDYSIKKGDTFFAIANRFNMKISTLLNVNNLGIRDTLSIGQVIKVNKNGYSLQEPTVEEKEPTTKEKIIVSKEKSIEHKVTSGDTMYALARKYNVSLKEIMDWNNKQDYSLKEGELIVIKQK